MPHTKKMQRNAKTGRFVVRSEGRDARGNEKYSIVDSRGRIARSLVVSESSAATSDAIMERHAKALKRLAKK